MAVAKAISKKQLADAIEAANQSNNDFERLEAKVSALVEYLLSQPVRK